MRVSCCAPSDLFEEAGKGSTEIVRATSCRAMLTQARRTEASCVASAVAATVVEIAEVRARA